MQKPLVRQQVLDHLSGEAESTDRRIDVLIAEVCGLITVLLGMCVALADSMVCPVALWLQRW